MSNLTRLEFTALDISERNYLTWQQLGRNYSKKSNACQQDRAKAMILLRHHLHESLKAQYLIIKDPSKLWKILKDRFDHQRTVIFTSCEI
ncbi:hypothetical protein V2J09_008542 [Rumex salicifolius]